MNNMTPVSDNAVQPSVSICVPCYNGAKYMAECLDSILTQSFTDFELLIVDDQSSDETLNIVSRYSDPRIRIYRNPANLGLVGNWNRCLELTRGEWIKFVFQDDVLEKDCLGKLMAKAAEGHKVVACNRTFIFGSTEESRKNYYQATKETIEELFCASNELSGSDFALASLRHLCINLLGEPSVVLLHKSVFEEYGVFNDRLIMGCDHEFWTRVGIHTGVAFVPQEMVRFRVHPGSESSKNHTQRVFRMSLDVLIIMHEYALNPHYQVLREVAAENGMDVQEMFRNEACMVHYVSCKAFFRPWNRNASMLRELRSLTAKNRDLAMGLTVMVPWVCRHLAKRLRGKR